MYEECIKKGLSPPLIWFRVGLFGREKQVCMGGLYAGRCLQRLQKLIKESKEEKQAAKTG